MLNLLKRVALVTVVLVAAVSTASAQNVLTNPSFDDPPMGVGAPPPGWIAFGSVFAEPSVPPQFVPASGPGLCSMFGAFSGGFNVSGIFQEFATVPGDFWAMSSNARHWSGDLMVGPGAPNSNWVVQKIAFFDVGDNEIGSCESTILDGTFAGDTWHASGDIGCVAPAGTVKVQALILYLQPAFDGGAAHIDDVYFAMSTVPTENSTWGQIKSIYK